MILTCPECASRYFVDDAKLSPQGRSVRCSACGARWTARAEAVLDLETSLEEGSFAAEPVSEPAEAVVPVSELPADELPRVFRARAEVRRDVRKAAAAGMVWAAMGVAFVGLLGAATLFRVEVVKLVPAAAGAYAKAGLPVNPTGLVFEDIKAEPGLENGRAVLIVSGAVRNVLDRPVEVPPLRIRLLGAKGERLADHVVSTEAGRTPPGEERHFVVNLVDPPTAARDYQVEFVIEAARPKAKPKPATPKASAHAAERDDSLRGPTEASALPAPEIPEAVAIAHEAHG